MISAARPASLRIRRINSRAFGMFGSGRSSQRSPVSPLVLTAASGWLTSCAIDAAISPSTESRAACAKSTLADRFQPGGCEQDVDFAPVERDKLRFFLKRRQSAEPG